jgi:YD repeat-containing protein
VSSFDAANRTLTTTSPVGRQHTSVFDAQGRLVSWAEAGLTPVQFGYDSRGRLTTTTQGTRQATISYDPQNRATAFTDPLQKTVTFVYDGADRVISQTLADHRTIGFEYDAHGNITRVVPPGRPAHNFLHTPANVPERYIPPSIAGTGDTSYTYNRDRQLTRIDRPDGDAITAGYDAAGRLNTVTFDAGAITFTYQTTGQIQDISAPGEQLSFTLDGPLPLTSTWNGTVAGVVAHTYTTDLTVASERVNGITVNFGYDNDGLLTQAGELTLTRHPNHGSLTGTTLGAVTDHYDWTGYGEPGRYQTRHSAFGSYPVFDAQYTRDDVGWITQIIETVDTIQRVWTYSYDDAGRLRTVRRNGDVAAAYTYDSNGNRQTYDGDRGHEEGTYDEQDRLLAYAGAAYGYTPSGDLATKTVGTQVTRYSYDSLGNLRSVLQRTVL